VWDDTGGEAQRETYSVKIPAELLNEGILGAAPGQEPAIRWPRIEEAIES
jgi:hypothetical protein